MKKVLFLILALAMLFSLAACTPTAKTPESNEPTTNVDNTPDVETPAETKSAGFIVMGLGSEFFQGIYDGFVEGFTADGWEATAVDGGFDPTKQIEAIENYTAMGVDVLCIFPVNGPAVDDALKKAQEAGVKVVEMVNCGNNWDVALKSENDQLAELTNLQAAKWVEDNFPDAEDGSIECVALTYYASEVNQAQAKVILEIENYSSKIKLVEEYQLSDESTEAGVAAAENIIGKHPNVKLIITAQGTVAVGVNNYLTSMNSPITDYSNLGIFACNASSEESFAAIKASGTDGAPMRGTVMTGGIDSIIADLLYSANGIYDGSLQNGHIMYAVNEVIQHDTVDEFLATGHATSYTQADLYRDMPNHFYKK